MEVPIWWKPTEETLISGFATFKIYIKKKMTDRSSSRVSQKSSAPYKDYGVIKEDSVNDFNFEINFNELRQKTQKGKKKCQSDILTKCRQIFNWKLRGRSS